jgi:hypothetical protein
MSAATHGLQVVLASLVATSAWADVKLLGKAQLVHALQSQPPCCVVDARADERRNALPLAEALPYQAGMKINPTATVVVIADSDAAATKVARALEKAYPGKAIVAVRGGHPVWESILIDQQAAAGSVQGSRSFVIPRNTCEQDTPLQTLLRKKAP